MAMATLTGALRPRADTTHLDVLRAGWQAFLRRRGDRAALEAVRRLGPRVRADIGLGEETPGFVGDWDALPTNGLLIRRR